VSLRSHRLSRILLAALPVLVLCLPAPPGMADEQQPDAFLRGYVAAWLLYEHGLDEARVRVTVTAGVVTLEGTVEDEAQRQRILETVVTFAGVEQVIDRLRAAGEPPAEEPRAGAEGERWQSWFRWLRPPPGRKYVRFPDGDLFTPPLADQKQPRFHTTYQRWNLSFGDFNIASVGFGETFGLLRRPAIREGEGWQLGISGAVLAIFNLDAESFDLLNADYNVGFPLSWRGGRSSARARLYHTSSHLGDEFLLNPQPVPPIERINLSYEALELLGSREIGPARIYGGWTFIVHSDTTLGRNLGQLGFEYRGPVFGPGMQVIAGLDLETWEETDWELDLSLKAGVRLLNPYRSARSIQFLFEYYDGRAPHGQFYNLDARYFGLGIAYSM